jgi:hypothetical protein
MKRRELIRHIESEGLLSSARGRKSLRVSQPRFEEELVGAAPRGGQRIPGTQDLQGPGNRASQIA